MASFNLVNGSMIILCVLCVVIIFSDNVNGYKLAKSYPGECKKANTRYKLPERCDTYMECIDSKPTRKTCRYGQYFYNITDVTKYACEYLNAKHCGSRAYHLEYVYDDSLCNEQFSQPQFRVGDDTTCNEFVECSHGRLFNKKCDDELAFHPVDHICTWPGESPDCDAPTFCAKLGKGYNSETKGCYSDDK